MNVLVEANFECLLQLLYGGMKKKYVNRKLKFLGPIFLKKKIVRPHVFKMKHKSTWTLSIYFKQHTLPPSNDRASHYLYAAIINIMIKWKTYLKRLKATCLQEPIIKEDYAELKGY